MREGETTIVSITHRPGKIKGDFIWKNSQATSNIRVVRVDTNRLRLEGPFTQPVPNGYNKQTWALGDNSAHIVIAAVVHYIKTNTWHIRWVYTGYRGQFKVTDIEAGQLIRATTTTKGETARAEYWFLNSWLQGTDSHKSKPRLK